MVQTKCGELKGYSPDFYFCLEEKIEEGMDCESAIAICEVLYGWEND